MAAPLSAHCARSEGGHTEALHETGREDMTGVPLVVPEPSGKITVLKDGRCPMS